MGDESASVVLIAGTKCDRNEIRQLADEPRSFTRLFHPGLGREHVQQITGDANEVENVRYGCLRIRARSLDIEYLLRTIAEELFKA